MIGKIGHGEGVTGLVRYCLGEGNEYDTGRRRAVGPDGPRAKILGADGFGLEVNSPERLELWRRFAEWSAAPENQHSRTKKCTNDALHLTLNYAPGEQRTDREMIADAREALAALGMQQATAAYIRHSDSKTHEHLHVVASRLNPTTGRTFDNTDERLKLTAWTLDWERRNDRIPEAKRDLHRMAEAVQSRDPSRIFEGITDKDATFTRDGLQKALALDPALANDRVARQQLTNDLLNHSDVVMMRGPDRTRFTTQTVLRHEEQVMEASRALGNAKGHSVWACNVVSQQRGLNEEQKRALWAATDDRGLALIAGQAGTGKTRTLQAIRETYREYGRDVLAMAKTNQVVNELRDAGFNSSTLEAEQQRAKHQPWAPGQVLLVDESGMLSTRSLDWLMSEARDRGAKVVMVGDDKQLGSIERGGLLTRLAAEHGASELREVQRVKEPELKRAFNDMHARNFASALETFERRGNIHWHDRPGEAEAALAAKYQADVTADPTKTRMMYAATNEAVDRLNHLAREHRKTLGELQNERTVQTSKGPQQFAVGDQVQFTKSGATPALKREGLVNGAFGKITKISRTGRMTVDVGAKKNGERRTLDLKNFDGIQHGYASTVFRTQGRTLDHTYALHTPHWREATSYVAMSRSRGNADLFVSREHAADIDELALSMGRAERKIAASSLGRVPPEQAAYLRARAADQVRAEADAYARRMAKELEPTREDWRAAERRADTLNRMGASENPAPRNTRRPEAPASQGRDAAAPNAASSAVETPQPQPTRHGPVAEPQPLAAKEQPKQGPRRDTERPEPTGPKEPVDRALRDRDGAPLGGAAHPRGPVERARQREADRELAKSQKPAPNAHKPAQPDSFPQPHVRPDDAGPEVRNKPPGKPERPQPRQSEQPRNSTRDAIPERPWALHVFRRAAEASNEKRRAELFTSKPREAPQSRQGAPSPPPHVHQSPERKRSVRASMDALTAALSGIRDRTRSAVSEWWNHRDRSEARAHARAGEDMASPRFKGAQGHVPPRTDPSPKGTKPSAEPDRDRPRAAPQPSAQPRTEPPRAAPTPPPQESREAPARDMRPQIKEALDRTFRQEPSPGRSRDGPRR